MATAQTLIDRALRLIGALASGDSPTAQESADGLISLNNLLESWQAEKLLAYALTDTAFTMTAADASYTVGPAGNFALTPRPSKIEDVYIRSSNIDYPVELIDFDRWNAIPSKTVTSEIASKAYYEPSLPTGTLQLWPVPSAANSLHIVTWTPCSDLAALSTTVAFPQGWERALAFNLAVEIAPEYGANPSDAVMRGSVESKAIIMRANHRPIIAVTDITTVTGRRSDIYSGGYV